MIRAALILLINLILLRGIADAQSRDIEKKVDSLLGIMTLQEKLGQLNQLGGISDSATPGRTSEEQVKMVRQGRVGSFLNVTGAAETERLQRVAVKETRLGIPLLFGCDVIHGFKTIFPIPLAEASTWNPELIERAEHIAAVEASAGGIHWTFAPMVDIARDPRWGRIAEGSGEDPFLGSVMAAAKVRGFQGKSILEQGSIIACAKHFAAYGGAEAGKDYNTVDMSERTLREIYLPPYKAAVDAGVWTLMSAFNEIGGVPCSGNQWLLTNVLRNEWGFKGFVVSDFESVAELMKHGVASTRTDAGILGLCAGVDMDMVDAIYVNELVGAVRSQRLSEEMVNQAVRRVLRVKFAYGLFSAPYRNNDTLKEQTIMRAPEHLALARTVAQQSIILLKNTKNVLPLGKTTKTVALIGPFAGNENRRELIGSWAWVEKAEEVVSVIDGIKEKVSPGTKILYAKGCEAVADSGVEIEKAVRIARQADVVVAVLGEESGMSGEAASRSELNLPGKQQELLEAICRIGKPVVLVIFNGRPLTISWAAENVDAIVEAWFPGVEAGNALADILFGDVNPSGKLPVTFPRSVGQIPLYYNHKNTGRPCNDSDSFTSRYIDIPNTPLYPFGFGLSYTTFAYTNLTVSSPRFKQGQNIHIAVDVQNTGKLSGDEVVQLYIQDEVASVTRPVKELKGFKKISLNAGEKKTIDLTVTPDDLSFYNLEMKKIVEPGIFKIFVGGSSIDAISSQFTLE
jgi:beta-glucosidase